MANLFGNQTTDGIEESSDRLGGFRIHDSGPYTGKIKAMYAGKSTTSNAQSVTVIVDTREDGEYRETFWVTNGKGENFFTDKNDKTKKNFLPGWTIVDDICLMTTNKGLADAISEDKMMNVYDAEAKKEIPKSVPMFVEVLNKDITLGIIKETKNKQKKDSNGVYQDTDETRDENITDKVFHFPSNLTVVEARKKIQTPTFYGAWVERNKGQTRDRTNKNTQSGRPGSPPKAGESVAKTASLF